MSGEAAHKRCTGKLFMCELRLLQRWFAARSSDRIVNYSLLEANGTSNPPPQNCWVNKNCPLRDIPLQNLPLFDKINLQYSLMPVSRSTLCVIAAPTMEMRGVLRMESRSDCNIAVRKSLSSLKIPSSQPARRISLRCPPNTFVSPIGKPSPHRQTSLLQKLARGPILAH